MMKDNPVPGVESFYLRVIRRAIGWLCLSLGSLYSFGVCLVIETIPMVVMTIFPTTLAIYLYRGINSYIFRTYGRSSCAVHSGRRQNVRHSKGATGFRTASMVGSGDTPSVQAGRKMPGPRRRPMFWDNCQRNVTFFLEPWWGSRARR